MSMKKILVTGSEGYIGSVLVPMLIDNGYEVFGLDIGYYAEANINGFKFPSYTKIKLDLRDTKIKDLTQEKFDAIIHLAALSNDPLGLLNEDLTYEINNRQSIRLAKMAKDAGIPRFIYSSSCSLYGQGDGLALTEKSESNPQTAYGKSKIMAETGIKLLADDTFCPVYMRNATAFGYSPRMRFDLVVNSLTGFAKVENEIKILGDGKPWRPLVHIRDIAGAMITALEAPKEKVFNEAFNVGDNKENYQIRTIAEMIKKENLKCEISIAKYDAGDTRDYNVSFNKLNMRLGYFCSWTLYNGITELKESYEKNTLTKNIFEHRLYTRLKQIEYLIRNNIIDNNLRRL